MTERSVTHHTFVIERRYAASLSRVFAAWADPVIKVRWFAGPEDWSLDKYDLDFRVGGKEHAVGAQPGGPVHTYEALYQDIVPECRIVTTYEIYLDQTRISVSLATVEFKPEGDAETVLVLTEQGAYLDGHDFPAEREEGTRELLDELAEELERQAANT
jgi:uncharacterized protein YndB with AHSA1/START domain